MQKLLQNLNIGKNLLRLRKMAGMTQADICAALDEYGRNMSISNYSQIETGRKNIYVSDLVLFKRIYDVSYDEFFQGLY